MSEKKNRCAWAVNDLLIRYHDEEYGRLTPSDQAIFEKICLESFSAGLSWLLVLRKRGVLRRAFRAFDIDACAALSDEDLEAAAATEGMIRNARKIKAVRDNARACAAVVSSYGSLLDFALAHREPKSFCAAMKRRGARQFGPVCSEELLKSLGILPAHEPGCYLARPSDGGRSCPRS